MTTIVILTILFLVLMMLPIAVAFLYFRMSKGKVMQIRQDVVRDQRYFAHSFAAMIERALPGASDYRIKLSKTEQYDDSLSIQRKKGDTVKNLVIIENGDFTSAEGVRQYEKEIYVAGDARFTSSGTGLRAVCSKKRMVLGNGTSVSRWADAEETLAVYDDCNLGISATAGKLLSIGQNATFRRLYAPVIYFGQYPDSLIDPMKGRDELVFMLPVLDDKKKIKHVTHENMTEEGTAPYSIITPTKTVIVENAVLQGNIHTVGNVRICAGSGVLGSIFSEGSILLEKGSFVVGNVFSQEKIEIEENVMIGKKGSMISVISRGNMTVGKDTVIYGYVSTESVGKVCPLYTDEKPRYDRDYSFLTFTEEPVDASFTDLHEYEVVDDAVFRKNPNVRSAVLPEGATSIRRSMFCECKNLVLLQFPKTLTELADYALYECENLTVMTSFADTALTKIGTSGMENCKSVTELSFPASLTELGPAALAGMTGLTKVSFADGCRLTTVSDHAFRDCEKLTEIVLPDGVKKVGVSAFRGCGALKTLSIPKAVSDEPGIAELKELLPGLKVEVRA